MLKRIGITQTVEKVGIKYLEYRDCLDQNWTKVASKLNSILLPLPNLEKNLILDYLSELNLNAIILSGGNTISAFDKISKEISSRRDNFEKILLQYAFSNNIPVLGVCRGMQMINFFFGGKLAKIKGHVGIKHSLNIVDNNYKLPKVVNSFHNWSIPKNLLAKNLIPIAYDNDNNVEAFILKEKKFIGIMWHPERESKLNDLDINLIKEYIL